MNERVRVVAALVAAFACSCSDASDGLTLHGGRTSVAVELDEKGGRLQLESGLELEVPAGALDRPVRIELEELRQSDLPDVRDGAGLQQPVAFRPHGQSFSRDVTIELPVDRAPEGQELRVLRLDDEEDQEWERIQTFDLRRAGDVGASDGRDRVELRTRGFSVYWVVAVASGVDAMSDAAAPEGGASVLLPDAMATNRDGGSMSPADPCLDFPCEQGFACVLGTGGTPACVAIDAGAVATLPDGGTDAGSGTGSDASVPVPDAGSFDAGPPPAFASCTDAFDSLGINGTECTGAGGSLGYECEGVLGILSGISCDDLCGSWGSTCSEAVESIQLACNSLGVNTVSCGDSAGLLDIYCACGIKL